ncbi:MAG: 6-bladed beta-propeller, partial [Pirellulaceae bacterium]|nr:6-bladed beta-propeller [Pirellulaceae bacterium]
MFFRIALAPVLAMLITIIAPPMYSSAQDKGGLQQAMPYRLDVSFPQQATGLVWQATSAVAIDSHGNVFVFHRATEPILKFDREGKLLRAFGEGLFALPHGMRIDNQDNLWVTDSANHTVVKFSADGRVLMSLGERDKAGDDHEHFNKPADVAFAANGDFYVADGYGNSRVVKFDKAGKFLSTWGKKGTGPGEFNLPHAVQVDQEDRIYVGDRENNRIQIFDAQARFLRQIEGLAPFGMYLTPDKHLWVADGRANRVIKMTLEGVELASWGMTGEEAGNFQLPH